MPNPRAINIIVYEFFRKVESQAPSQTYWVGIYILTRSPGDSNVHFHLIHDTVMITWRDNWPIEKELMHKLLSNNESNYMIFLQLNSQLPAMLFFSFFSLTVISNFVDQNNNVELIQSYIVGIYVFPGLHLFLKNSLLWACKFSVHIFFLMNAASLTKGWFFISASKICPNMSE